MYLTEVKVSQFFNLAAIVFNINIIASHTYMSKYTGLVLQSHNSIHKGYFVNRKPSTG